MAAHEMQLATASPADIAADMEHHRQTYGRFLKLLRNICLVSAGILIVVFFVVQAY